MIEQANYLSELDAVAGDAEHGINMSKGFAALKALLPEMEGNAPFETLMETGNVIMSKTGGSAGVLYGTFFLEAAKACRGVDALDAHVIANMLRGALNGMMKRGGAIPGDKTMIDTIYPAVEEFEKATAEGRSLQECSALCTKAAKDGMERTKEMIAKKGRASYVGEKSMGHQDPGATSMYYVFEQAEAYISSK